MIHTKYIVIASITALLVIAAYFYTTKFSNNKIAKITSDNHSRNVSIPTYTPTPTPEYTTIMTNKINGDKYTSLTSLDFWDQDFKDEIINTVNNGPRYARRARVEKRLEDNVLAVKFDDGQNYRLVIKDDLEIGAPVYTYNHEKGDISGYKIKKMNVSAINYLSQGSIIVTWFYEKSLDAESKTITPYELLIADIK